MFLFLLFSSLIVFFIVFLYQGVTDLGMTVMCSRALMLKSGFEFIASLEYVDYKTSFSTFPFKKPYWYSKEKKKKDMNFWM